MKFLFLDTETAAASPDCVIEIGAKFKGEPEGHSFKMKPRFKITPCGLAVHGVTNRLAEAYPDPTQALKDFKAKYDLDDPDVVVVGWNIQFDVDKIADEYAAAKLPVPKYKTLDLMVAAKRLLNASDVGKYNLDTVYCYFAEADDEKLKRFFKMRSEHGALSDVILTEEVYDDLLALSTSTPEKFYDNMTRPAILKEVPFGKYKGLSFPEMLKDAGYTKWMLGDDLILDPKNKDLRFTFEHYGKRVTARPAPAKA